MNTTRALFSAPLLTLVLSAPALGADFLQVDAAAPGMDVVVSVLRSTGGFTGSEIVTTSCGDVQVGPVWTQDSEGVTGAVLTTVFSVDPDASEDECGVFIDGVGLAANGGYDNSFSIVTPLAPPIDGGSGDADGVADGVITVASTDRSDGGVVVFESLAVDASETLAFDLTDPNGGTDANEAYQPAVVLVVGDVSIAGAVDVSGTPGHDWGDNALGGGSDEGDGGDGGPGAGGGGGGGAQGTSSSTSAPGGGGAGFAGGGAGLEGSSSGERNTGGVGAGDGYDDLDGGDGPLGLGANGLGATYQSTHPGSGGSGHPFGSGGGASSSSSDGGLGGSGGGGGSATSNSTESGGGGGGFGTVGDPGGSGQQNGGGAGAAHGADALLPLAGGSGGGGGDGLITSTVYNQYAGGGGGGGGGALMLVSWGELSIDGAIYAEGGGGGDADAGSSACSGGGGGSGGGVHLAGRAMTVDGFLSATGGTFGENPDYADEGGAGGEGRIRLDGLAPASPSAGPTGTSATTWEGCIVTEIDAAVVSVSSAGDCDYAVYDSSGGFVEDGVVAADDTLDLSATLLSETGDLRVYVTVGGVPSPLGVGLIGDGDFDGIADADDNCPDDANPDQADLDLDGLGDACDACTDVDGDGYGDPDIEASVCEDDCDDGDATISPDADEVCDAVDNDCDGATDEGGALDAEVYYADSDEDGFGDADASLSACAEPDGYVIDATDCDDGDGTINPDADEVCDEVDQDCDEAVDEDAIDTSVFYADGDEDGFGDPDVSVDTCFEPDGYVADAGPGLEDCDDGDADINPDADEVCDGVDQDCDEAIDEDAVDASIFYADDDEDGFGDADSALASCEQPDGYTSNTLDCDDTDADISPNGTEVCNGTDDDCDESVDEESTDALTWYADADDDGFGDALFTLSACEQPDGYTDNDADCDDDALTGGDVNPDADEVCNGIDDDCDADIDEDALDALDWYLDFDEDGFGDPDETSTACDQPDGYVDNDEDCDDGFTTVYPDATEICDGLDNDCDEFIDEEATDDAIWYADADEDGFGDPDDALEDCAQPDGYIDNDFDCDDGDIDVSPAADEYCDGIDNDCDGVVDNASGLGAAVDALTWYLDADEDDYGDPDETTTACEEPDGYSDDDRDCDDDDEAINPGVAEIWYDGVDQNCDSLNDFDQDRDGYVIEGSDAEAGGSATEVGDCEDTDATLNPGADDDWYDGIDSDCDGASDYDADGDGFDSASYGGDDCDDSDAETYPGAPDEPGDGVVTDCDETDEYDADGDGFDGESFGGDDCDDANGDINPDTPEVYYDGLDNDCDDATIDDDQDGDGVTVDEDCDDLDPDLYPGAPGYDEDCEPLDTGDTGDDTGDTGDDTGPDDTGPAGDDTGATGDDTAPSGDDTAVVSGDDTDSDTDSDIGGDDIDDDKGGCGCGGERGDTAWFLLLPGALWLRRRRRGVCLG